MTFESFAIALAGGLFVGMLLLQEIGRRLAARHAGAPDGSGQGASGILDGAIFALLGLLIAFTFSGAASRFDYRRTLIIDEANAIGTAYLRLDLLPAPVQPEMRELFRDYLDARLAGYRALPDVAAAQRQLERAAEMQQLIWAKAVSGAAGVQPATMLLLPALNQMFDIATARTWQTQFHPPTVVFALLFGLALVAALVAGHATGGVGRRNWVHMLAFAFALAGAVFVIIDLEFPRVGFIRVDAFDQALVEVRQGMR
jgi:hypothetical protein